MAAGFGRWTKIALRRLSCFVDGKARQRAKLPDMLCCRCPAYHELVRCSLFHDNSAAVPVPPCGQQRSVSTVWRFRLMLRRISRKGDSRGRVSSFHITALSRVHHCFGGGSVAACCVHHAASSHRVSVRTTSCSWPSASSLLPPKLPGSDHFSVADAYQFPFHDALHSTLHDALCTPLHGAPPAH